MITLNLSRLLREQWHELRTVAYVCPDCGVRIQACLNERSCRCGKIAVAGTVYCETTRGMPTDGDHYVYAVGR